MREGEKSVTKGDSISLIKNLKKVIFVVNGVVSIFKLFRLSREEENKNLKTVTLAQ